MDWDELPTLDRLDYLYWVELMVEKGMLPSNMEDSEILEKCKRMYYCDISLEATT